MNPGRKNSKTSKVNVEAKRSKYAGKPLNSSKEKAAKKFEPAAMEILKQYGLVK